MINARNSNKRQRIDEVGSEISASVTNINKDMEDLIQSKDITGSEKDVLNTIIELKECSFDLLTLHNNEVQVEKEVKEYLHNQINHLESSNNELKRRMKEKNVEIREWKEKYNTLTTGACTQKDSNPHIMYSIKEQSLLEQMEALQQLVKQKEDSLHEKEQQCRVLLAKNIKYKQLADVFRKQNNTMRNKVHTATLSSSVTTNDVSAIISNSSTTNYSITTNTIELLQQQLQQQKENLHTKEQQCRVLLAKNIKYK